jgi:pimeloyl-ACP methyl ester carboxylesterase
VTDELGATASVIFPKSSATLEEDAAFIRDEVIRLTDSQQRPVVLVGHSKGGAGVVLTALKYPELVRGGRVVDVVSIQGALHGSPVADAMTEALPIPFLHEHFRGLQALTRIRSEAAFRSAPIAADQLAWYRDHVFFVRSSETTSVVAVELSLSHAFLSRFGRNDGMVCEADQLLEGVGRDLGVLRADHAALTVAAPVSGFTAESRRAFTRALLAEIFEPAPSH